MPQQQGNRSQAVRQMQLNRDAVNDETRTVRLSFASEEPYQRIWGMEILQCTPDAINLQRFNSGLGCLLYNHNRDQVIGHIESVEIIYNKAYADVRFDADEQSNLIYEKVKSGTLQGVSVGYRVDSWEDVEAGKQSATMPGVTGPASIAMRWEPLEISIVSVPADATVGVGRSEEEIVINEEEEKVMPGKNHEVDNVRTEVAQPVLAPVVNEEEIRAAAAEAERTRAADITALCRNFDIDADEYIRSGATVASVQTAVLNKLAEERAAVPSNMAEIRQGAQEADKIREAVSDSILMRGGINVANPAEGAMQYRGMRLRELMIDTLEREGKSNARYMDDADLIRAALTGTGAFPNIMASTVNKAVATAYQAAPTTFEQFTSVGSLSDFKPTKAVRISEAGELVEIKENGEFKYDELTDAGVDKVLLTFGRSFGLTRQAIINDDLGMLTKIPRSYAAAARRGINRLVYKVLSDSKLYDTKKGNLGSASDLTVEALSEGRRAMRVQKNIRNKETLGIAPKYLIVPAALETKAYQLIHSMADPSQSNAAVVNPFASSLTIVTDAELDAISETAWYLAAAPGLGVDTIEVSYLNGKNAPTIESRVAWDTLGMEYRIYMDYGVQALDHKGLYKSAE